MTTTVETQNAELDTMIAELQQDPEVSIKAAVRLTAEQFRRSLCFELKEQRNRLGVSQGHVAHLIGTSQPAIARLEAGLADPKLSTLTRYAAALGFELRFTWQQSEALVGAVSR